MSLAARAVWGYGWVLAGFAAKTLAHLAALVWLSRLLSKAEYGEISIIFAVYNLVWSTVEVAIGYTVVRLPTSRRFWVHSLATVSALAGIAVFLLLALTAPWVAMLYAAPAIVWPVLVLGVGVLIRSRSLVSEFLLYKEARFDVLARIDIAAYGWFLAALALVIVAELSFWALPVAQFAYMAAKSLLVRRQRPHSRAFVLRRRALKHMAHYVGGYAGASLLSALATESDKFIVGRMLGLPALGVYGRAVQLFMLPASVVGQAADNVLTSLLSQQRRDPARHLRAIYAANNVMSLVMLPCSVVFFLLAPEIVAIVLGSGWEGAVAPLRILCVGMYFRTALKISEAVLRAQGLVWQRVAAYAQYNACLVVALIAGSVWGGMNGVAWAAAGCSVLFFFLLLRQAAMFLGLSMRRLAAEHLRGVALAALVLVISWPLLSLLRDIYISAWAVALTYLAVVSALAAILLWAGGGRRILGENGYTIYTYAYGLLSRSRAVP